MNVIVTINGREAIPVRAIPLLTDWEVLSPDVCAKAFAGDEEACAQHMEGLPTYRLNADGGYEAVAPRWWANWVVRELDACSERIKATETSREGGYQQWRRESLPLLPAGVFVWRDEFEAAYQLEYGPDSMRVRPSGEPYDAGRYTLNFTPEHGPGEDWFNSVLRGFEPPTGPVEQLAFVRGFYGTGKNDAHWLSLANVTPQEAAVLLWGKDPLVLPCETDERIAMLERRLTDYNTVHPKHRSWREWHQVAKEIGADYERGFDCFFADAEQASAQAAANEPVVAETAGVTWAIAKPQRYSGYPAPLYSLLTAAHREGRQRPTARDTLDAWRRSKPPEIAKVLTDSVDYYDANGNTKTADLDAIRKAIGRMTTSGR